MFLEDAFACYLGTCCKTVEVYYTTRNAAQSKIIGSYIFKNEKVNGKYFYQSNFKNEIYGIWWCGNAWYISNDHDKGQCWGYARSSSTEFCLENIGATFNAKIGLSIRCQCTKKI